jgi:hypothetical protein
MHPPNAPKYRTSMVVRCSTGDCPCQKPVEVEVFQTGTGLVIEHAEPVVCEACDHRWDMHSGSAPAARQRPAA